MLPVVPTHIFINDLCQYCSLCPSFIDRVTWTRATIFERICFAVWHSFQDIPPLHLSSKPTCRRYNLVHNVVCSSRHLVPQDVSGSYHCAPARYSRSFYLLSLKDVSLFSRVEVYIFTPARDISYRLSMPHILCLSAWYHPAFVHSSAQSAHIIYQTNHKCEHIMCAILASMYISYVLLYFNLIIDFILYVTAILPLSI